MTPECIQKGIPKLPGIAETNFSDNASLYMEDESVQRYYHCFIVNNQPYPSSNITWNIRNFPM